MRNINDELRMAGDYARNLIEASLDSMVTIGLDGRIMDVNAETEVITGRSREELVGSDFSDNFTNPDHAGAAFEEARKEGLVRNYPLEIQHRDGHVTPVLYNSRVYRDASGKVRGVFASARDISEQKKTEIQLNQLLIEQKGSQAQLVHAGKMGAMGAMTAGIAHELNNPIMGILNFIQYCLKHTDDADKRFSVLKDAEQEVLRCSDIVQNLLTFSRMEQEGEEEFQQGDLDEILRRVRKLLAYRIKADNIQMTRHMDPKTPHVWMKENNIQQVVLNLMDNAIDSIHQTEKKEIHVDLRPEGHHVQLSIRDTGCGIPEENQEKIFDPFFTTKSEGQGTGLGLSICHSIVSAHGGQIICESTPGKGSTFKVLLPIQMVVKSVLEGPVAC